MKTFTADGITITNNPARRTVTIQLWTGGAESERVMTEDEAIRRVASIMDAITANRKANADPK